MSPHTHTAPPPTRLPSHYPTRSKHRGAQGLQCRIPVPVRLATRRPHLPPSGGQALQPLPTAAKIQRSWQRLAARCSRVQGGRAPRECRGAASGAHGPALRGGSGGRAGRSDRSRGAGDSQGSWGSCSAGRPASDPGWSRAGTACGQGRGSGPAGARCGAHVAAPRWPSSLLQLPGGCPGSSARVRASPPAEHTGVPTREGRAKHPPAKGRSPGG